MQAVRAIGLMSGTSLDGVDAAMIETDGERIFRFGPTGYRPYRDDERTVLRQALAEKRASKLSSTAAAANSTPHAAGGTN